MTVTLDLSSYRIREFWLAMVLLLGVSSLPFFNELVTDENGTIKRGLLPAGLQNSLSSEDDRILGYSKFRVLLYYLFSYCYILIASLGWYSVAFGKRYRNALLLCTTSALYHIFLIVSENRYTWLNDVALKLWGTLGLGLIFYGIYYWSERKRQRELAAVRNTLGGAPKAITSVKNIAIWLGIAALSIAPYFHDIITERYLGVKEWVPNLGLQEVLSLSDGTIRGFSSYRVLLLTLLINLFAQIMWLGWWTDAKYSIYKPFLLVPLGSSFYELSVIVFVKTDTYLNKPDLKFLMILILGILIGLSYYFKNGELPKRQPSITDVVPQNRTYKNHMK